MIIFPAIDLKDSKVVRLRQGKFSDVTEYSQDPVAVARDWVRNGASWLHLVDLDGALEGKMKNFDAVQAIIAHVKVPVQIGGGIRTEEDVKKLFSLGVKRVILGTRVIQDKSFLSKLLKQYPDQIAVSLDCKDGKVAQRGWTEVTDVKGTDMAKDLESLGLKCLIYTDVKRDGMLSGPNLEGLSEILSTVKIPVIASGGISSLDDIKNLLAIKPRAVLGAITGRAIYEGTLNLKKAIDLCSKKE